MELRLFPVKRYRMKRGQNLSDVARAFSLPPRLLASYNRLAREPREGEILEIPERCGDLYTVRGGESKKLLCGSEERFAELNGTDLLYIGQTVLLG